jgi:hypothetical protein
MHGGMLIFCPRQQAEDLKNLLQANSLVIEDTADNCEYKGYTLQIDKGSIYRYKLLLPLRYV